MASIVAYANANYTHPDATTAGWTNATNAYADDGSYATRAGTSKNTWYGNLFGFDLSSLPDAATVSAISLEVQWKNSAADTSGPVLGLGAYSAGALVGTEATDTTGQTSDELLTKAPTGISVAALKTTGAEGFAAGVRFRRTDNTAHTASLDYVKCTITYSLDLSGTAAMSNADSESAAGEKATAGSAVASAVAAIVAAGAIALFGAGAFAAEGGATASGLMGAQGAATVSCESAITATGEASAEQEEHSGTATLSGTIDTTGSGEKNAQDGAEVSATQTAEGSGSKAASGDAALTGEGGATATGEASVIEEHSGEAVLSGVSETNGSGSKAVGGTVAFSGEGEVTAWGLIIGGPASISGYGITSAQGLAVGLLERNRNGISISLGIGVH